MRRHWRVWILTRWSVIGIAGLALFGAGGVCAAEPIEPFDPHDMPFVCAQVVLAIDGSGSTANGAFHRQIDAFQTAFGSEHLYHAIQDCLPGSVAFAVTTWSGPDEQALCLDWSLVLDPDDGRALAQHLESCRYFGGTTDIGRAVDHGLGVLENSPFVSYYRIVFVLTNGRTDRGAEASLAAARAQAAAAGVTLAAYALLHQQPERRNPFFAPDTLRLERYVADEVSAGPRAFTAHARPPDDADTLLRALAEMLRQEAS